MHELLEPPAFGVLAEDPASDGIAVDANGDVWIANYGCGGDVAWRYQPTTGQWQSVGTGSKPRGIAASPLAKPGPARALR